MVYYYRFVSQQVTSEKKYYWNFDGWFSWDWCHNWRHHFLMSLLIKFAFSGRDSTFLGPPLKKKWELCGTRFILGTSGVIQVQPKLRRSKFIHIEEWCPQYSNKPLRFSGLGTGFLPWSHRFNSCYIQFFSTGWTILALLSSSWTHNKLYSMLLAGIFPAKRTEQKVMEC
jgi:hypothetical protein